MTNRTAQARESLKAIERQQRYSVISPHGSGLGHEVDEDTFICEIAAALLAVEQRVWAEAAQRGQAMIDAYPMEVFLEPPAGQHGETVDACSARMGRHDGKVFRDWCRAKAQLAQGRDSA